MEPEWEYKWEFVQDGKWSGVKQTNFWMTDYEAERWWAFGRPGTRRIEETKRDRVADVLGRADERAGELAEYADRARIAGQQCERDYDALTIGAASHPLMDRANGEN
jgi:hypothetical protein